MRYLIKVGRCTIGLEGARDDKGIELTLQALAGIISGVDTNEHWPIFNELMRQVNEHLIQACRKID